MRLSCHHFKHLAVRRAALLLLAIFSNITGELSANAATGKAISPSSGVFVKISQRFDGKAVSCRLMTNGKFEPGYVVTQKKKNYWNSPASYIKKIERGTQPVPLKTKKRVLALQKTLTKLKTSCARKATSYCNLSIVPKTVRFSDLLPVSFPLELTNSCKLPFTLEQVDAPEHGTLSGTPQNLTYTPREAGRFIDGVNLRLKAVAKTSDTARLSFAGELSAACLPTLSDSAIAIVENTELIFAPNFTNLCNLASSFIIINSPASGALTVTPNGLSYIPEPHFLASTTARVQVENAAGSSSTQTITFNVQAGTAQFAGDKNLMHPYREQLTEDEVNSLLKRVGMGGNAALRSMRSLSQLVDALLVNTETSAVTDYQNNQEAQRLQGVSSPTNPGIRAGIGQIKNINIQALRYGQPLKTWMAYNFWMNHFATDIYSTSAASYSEAMLDYITFIRKNGTQNFETLLTGFMKSLLPHYYLNSFDNSSDAPNQNFPREALELFTAGIKDPITNEPNFRESDVAAATAIFAGMYWQSAALGYRPVPTTLLGTPKMYDVSDDDAPVRSADLNCARRTANRIQIRWASTDRRGNYARILRAPLGSNTFQNIAEVGAYDQEYHDYVGTTACPRSSPITAPSPGAVYQYKMQFIQKDIAGIVSATSPESAVDTGYFAAPSSAPAIPANQTASVSLADRISLSWSTVPGATSYRIYRTGIDLSNDDFIIAEVNAPVTSYDDLSVFTNKAYRYYIRAVNSTTKFLSPHSVRFVTSLPTSSVYGLVLSPDAPSLAAVEFIKASQDNNAAVTLTWNPVAGAAGYRVYSSPAYLDWYTQLADVTNGTAYQDTQVGIGQLLYYWVVPFDSSRRLATYVGAAAQTDSRFLVESGVNRVRPKRAFLDWMLDSDPNVAGRIIGPEGTGDYYSVFGQTVSERILGRAVPATTKSFLDHVLYNWPATSRNIAAKLFASLVHREINEEIINYVARELIRNRYNMQGILRTLLMSSASFSPEANGTCVMNPTEVVMTFLRMSELPVTKTASLTKIFEVLGKAGHDVAQPPSVFGFKNCGLVRGGFTQDGSDWIASSQTYIAVGNGISAILKQMTDSSAGTGEGVDLTAHFVPAAGQMNSSGVVNAVARKLGITLSAGETAVLANYMDKNAIGQVDAWRRGLAPAELSARIAGLLRLMIMSPDFLNK